MLTLVVSSAVGFRPTTAADAAVATPRLTGGLIGRRAVATSIPVLFLGAAAAEAVPGEIRKANPDAIGVSRVELPKQAAGNPGAGVLPVELDTAGWKGIGGGQTAVIGPSGAAGGSPNGFLCLGDKDCYKKSEKKKKAAAAPAAAAPAAAPAEAEQVPPAAP